MVLDNSKTVNIIIPAKSTERESFAANELKKYLKMICGAESNIIADENTVSGQSFLIGGPERNKITGKYITETEFDKIVPGPEGVFIKSYDDCIVLAGSSKNINELERGTVYAVYEFLERFLGCSLSAYTKEGVEGGEYIAKQSIIEINDIFFAKAKSDIPYRSAVAQYSAHGKEASYELDKAFLDWLSKNRYNYIYTWNGVYEHFKENGMLDECIKRGILFKVGHHDAIDTLLPQRGNKYLIR